MATNLKAKNFPKVSSINQLIKQPIKSFDECLKNINLDNKTLRALKVAMGSRDIIKVNGVKTVALNVSSFMTGSEWDKSKTIKATRLAAGLTDSISLYGWNGLILKTNFRYGSCKSLLLIETILKFVKKHAEAYRQELDLKPYKITFEEMPKELSQFKADSLFSKDETAESCYIKMWDYVSGSYYVYDDLLNDLILFGYTNEQIRQLIHTNYVTDSIQGIPKYLKNKYFYNPDGSKQVRDLIKKINQ